MRKGGLAEQAGEHRVLAADLLDAVDLEGVLDVPVALVLAGQVAVEAALDQHRDDLVVRDRVLDWPVDRSSRRTSPGCGRSAACASSIDRGSVQM